MKIITKGQTISKAARAALVDEGFESAAGYCWRWCRQALRAANVGAPIPPLGVDAREAHKWYVRQGLAIPPTEKLQEGDIVFKIAPNQGAHGHVGIYVGNSRIAENSSAHVGGRDREARGTRTLSGFGPITGVVRIR